MVCWQERVVLQGAWKGMPRAGGRLRSCRCHQPTLRLQCRLCQLDGRMECAEEGLVLQECRQGLPSSSWRLCLKPLLGSMREALEGALALAPSSGDALNMLLLTAKFALRRAEHSASAAERPGLNATLAHSAIFGRASNPRIAPVR